MHAELHGLVADRIAPKAIRLKLLEVSDQVSYFVLICPMAQPAGCLVISREHKVCQLTSLDHAGQIQVGVAKDNASNPGTDVCAPARALAEGIAKVGGKKHP